MRYYLWMYELWQYVHRIYLQLCKLRSSCYAFTCIWVLNQRSRWTCSNRQTWSRFHRPRWKCLWETWTTRCHRYGKCGCYSAWWRLSRQTPSCIRPESSHDFPGKSGSYSRQTVIQTAGWSKDITALILAFYTEFWSEPIRWRSDGLWAPGCCSVMWCCL